MRLPPKTWMQSRQLSRILILNWDVICLFFWSGKDHGYCYRHPSVWTAPWSGVWQTFGKEITQLTSKTIQNLVNELQEKVVNENGNGRKVWNIFKICCAMQYLDDAKNLRRDIATEPGRLWRSKGDNVQLFGNIIPLTQRDPNSFILFYIEDVKYIATEQELLVVCGKHLISTVGLDA